MRKLISFFMLLLLTSELMSQELSDYSVTVDNTTYTSIAATGTQLTSVYGDYANQTFSLPFSFEFGTKSIARGTTMRVRSDGHVLINLSGTYNGSDYGYDYWPVNTSYNYCAIVPYTNDDGYMPNNTSAVYWQVEESYTGDSVLVVEFVDVEHYIDNGEQFNYQLRIYQNGDISVTYGSMTGSSNYANFMMTANDTYDRVLLAGSWNAPTPACPAQMTYLSGAPDEGTVITYVRPTEYCAKPASLAVTTITSNDATVSWTGSDDAIIYTYEYDLVDFVPGTGTHNEGTTSYNSIDLTGLSAQTNYYFYVKSECNNGEESRYASITFRTACGEVTDFPWSDGFEDASSIDCWTLLDLNGSTSDNWTRYSSYSHSGNYSMRSSYNSSVAANDWLITPPILVPSDAEGLTLKWFVRGSSYSNNVAHYTVRLSTTGNNATDFTDSLFAESYGNSTYVERMVNLDSYAGETVYIAFIHDSYNDNGLYLDDISVYSTLPPVVSITGPTQAYEGVDAIFQVVLNEGSENGIQYTWTSTMESNGLATITDNGDIATVTYFSGGTDTILVTASNIYGNSTAYLVVNVCGTIVDIPWGEGFESASSIDCWTILDLDGSTNDNWARYYSSYSSHTGTYSMRSYYNSSAAANDWLITPPIEIPTDAEGLVLTWYVKGSTFSSNVSHYSVKISTTGNNAADFITTLYEESYGEDYINRSVSLENYAGETVYIAFVHDSYNDNGIYLDDIAIRSALVPVVTLTAPATAMTGENIMLTANLLEGSSTGLTYNWSNTLNSTLTPAGNNATIIYSTGGTDIIQVIASNAYGADTAYATITVLDCSPVTTFPWSEGFESGNDAIQCWTIIDNNNFTDDNWLVVSNDYDTYSYEGNYCLAGPYHEYGSCDDYIISPAIVIPANVNDLWLSYYVKGGEYEGNVTSYRTLISTTGTTISDFTNVLINETYAGDYEQRSFSLAAYAGQTIHIAFHQTSYDANNMFIDNILIDHVQTPIECNAPTIINASASDSTVTITWTGNADSYTVAINAGNWAEPSTGVNVNGFTYTFSGLSSNTQYAFGIRSICADGNSSSWVTQQITTSSTTPPIGIVGHDELEVKLYPNPASHNITIEAQGLKQLELMDISGRSILLVTDIDSDRHQLDVSTIASGVYFIHLRTDNFMTVRKLVIDK